ncbi:glutaredoxin family protein [Lactococcus lactis]|uniref:glutaredoxin family protein n=1 Tax=Lactococcus lactis TaxID=1358 RepID=UPI0024179D1F|nr:glutaredoxin family protein [Lactococcus lactis]MDG4973420.1 glutaredoxin family protein [Lactococcus lactis]
MKIYIKNKKKFFQRVFLGLVLAAVMLGGTGGIIHYVKTQNGSKDLVETPNVMQRLNESEKKTQKIILVFFKDGCPYCEAAKTEIEEAKIQANFPVLYVNTESRGGQQLKQKYKLQYASSLVIIQKQKNTVTTEVVAYGDKIRGQYVPLTENIQKAFENL